MNSCSPAGDSAPGLGPLGPCDAVESVSFDGMFGSPPMTDATAAKAYVS